MSIWRSKHLIIQQGIRYWNLKQTLVRLYSSATNMCEDQFILLSRSVPAKSPKPPSPSTSKSQVQNMLLKDTLSLPGFCCIDLKLVLVMVHIDRSSVANNLFFLDSPHTSASMKMRRNHFVSANLVEKNPSQTARAVSTKMPEIFPWILAITICLVAKISESIHVLSKVDPSSFFTNLLLLVFYMLPPLVRWRENPRHFIYNIAPGLTIKLLK